MFIIILYFQTASWIPPTLPRVRYLDIVMQYLSSSLTVNYYNLIRLAILIVHTAFKEVLVNKITIS